jgi:hypothetical protein
VGSSNVERQHVPRLAGTEGGGTGKGGDYRQLGSQPAVIGRGGSARAGSGGSGAAAGSAEANDGDAQRGAKLCRVAQEVPGVAAQRGAAQQELVSI